MTVVFSARGAPSRTPFYCGGSCAVATARSSSRPTEPPPLPHGPLLPVPAPPPGAGRWAHRRCPERRVRADELDNFVFDQVRQLLAAPELLSAGEAALAAQAPVPDDELLAA